MQIRTGKCSACVVAVGVGAAIFTAGVFLAGFSPMVLIIVGAVVLHASLARLTIRPALRPQEELFQAGYELGESHGYNQGRRVSRLTVVPIRVPVDAQAN